MNEEHAPRAAIRKVNLVDKFSQIAGEPNDAYVKLVKF